jgi:RNA polymerase sigma factor (sigma-70 family)
MSAEDVPGQDQAVSLEDLVRQSRTAIFGLCFVYTRNVHDAEDLLQETLLRAVAGIRELRDPRSLRAWVMQIARRICINHCRRKRYTETLPEDLAAPSQDVDTRPQRLQAALASLPQEYRETVSIYYMDGRSCAGVAEALGINEAAVRVRLARGRWMLHELLKEDEA